MRLVEMALIIERGRIIGGRAIRNLRCADDTTLLATIIVEEL